VVCRGTGPADGAAAGPGEAPHRLSARQRLAGAQAGGLRALRLPGGPVSDGDVSAGLRRAGGAATRACRSGVRADLAPGDRRRRGRRRGGAGEAVGAGTATERAGRAGVARPGDALVRGGAGDGAGGRSAGLRCAPGRGGVRE
jgi:hypothetical protein